MEQIQTEGFFIIVFNEQRSYLLQMIFRFAAGIVGLIFIGFYIFTLISENGPSLPASAPGLGLLFLAYAWWGRKLEGHLKK